MTKGSQFQKPKKSNGQKGRDNLQKSQKNSHDIKEQIIAKKSQCRLHPNADCHLREKYQK